MKAEELDQLFDEGEDITPYLDLSTLQRPAYQQNEEIHRNFLSESEFSE